MTSLDYPQRYLPNTSRKRRLRPTRSDQPQCWKTASTLKPLLDQVDFIFSRTLAPSTSPDPKRRLSHLCDRLWLIAAIEHYTAVLAQRSKEDRRQSSGTVPAWTCGHHLELGSVPVASQLPSKDGYHRPTTGGK